MTEEQNNDDLSMWLSTYGLVTVERILERYKIRLQQQDLITAIKNPNSLYHHLLRIPLKNVYNGIILQQAHDYQVYAQKLFVDYLLSGETVKSEESPGNVTREYLEEARKDLMKKNDEFRQEELNQEVLISKTQSKIIQLTKQWEKLFADVCKTINAELGSSFFTNNALKDAITILLIIVEKELEKAWPRIESLVNQPINPENRTFLLSQIILLNNFIEEVDLSLNEYAERISDLTIRLREYREMFYNTILRINELIQALPEYRVNKAQTEENRESLLFDKELGDKL